MHRYLSVRWPRKITVCETPRCDHQAFQRNAQPAPVQFLWDWGSPQQALCRNRLVCAVLYCISTWQMGIKGINAQKTKHIKKLREQPPELLIPELSWDIISTAKRNRCRTHGGAAGTGKPLWINLLFPAKEASNGISTTGTNSGFCIFSDI